MTTELTKKEIEMIACIQTLSVERPLRGLYKANEESPIFIGDVVELTGYAQPTIYKMIHQKQIPFHKIAGQRRLFFYKSELLDWMNNKRDNG